MTARTLSDVRILGAINGIELFGHERGHIQVYKLIASLGGKVRVGVNASENGGAVGRELRLLGIETFTLPFGPQWSLRWLIKHPSLVWRNPLAVLRCSYRFRREIAGYHPTHLMLGNSLAYSYLCLALSLTKIPLVYRNGDAVPTDSSFNYPIWKCALRRADWVVANSDFVKRSTVACGISDKKISVIYNSAPTARGENLPGHFPPAAADEVFPRLVYVGNIAEHKGLVPLVLACSILVKQWPSLELNVVGGSRWDSEFRERLESLVSELDLESRVHFLGFVEDPSELYRCADVHVLPSLWDEPSANVVVEAKREGVPSVAFHSGGTPELIRHGIDGVICEAKTPEAFAAGIGWLIQDTSRLRLAGREAQADYANRFGIERFLSQWASVLIKTARSLDGRRKPDAARTMF